MRSELAALAMLAVAVAAVLAVVLSGTLGDEQPIEVGATADADARPTPDAPRDENSGLALAPPKVALPPRFDRDRTQRGAGALVPVAAGRGAGATGAEADGSVERSSRERVGGGDEAPRNGDGPSGGRPGGEPPDGGSPGGGSGPPPGGGGPPPGGDGGGEPPPDDDDHPGRGSDDAPGRSEDGPPGHSREGTPGHDREGGTEGESAHGS